MSVYVYRSSSVEKRVKTAGDRIVEISFLNLVTGRELVSPAGDFEVLYSRGGERFVADCASCAVERIGEDGYTLRSADGALRVEISYSARDCGALAKTVTLRCDRDIFIDCVTVEKFSTARAEFVWQAPFAGKTYLSQSVARLGQPLYAGDLFFGCETPVSENFVRKNTAYCRYHTGRNFGDVCKDGAYVLPDVVTGGGAAADFASMRRAFFAYVESFARPAVCRIQYNSWYDNMLDIDPERIENSFTKVHEGLKKAGAREPDCYVVDDGWTEYRKPLFWQFNDKFPEGFAREAALTASFGSRFGVWFGPRGGYTAQTVRYARLLEKIGYHVNEKSQDICTADARYIEDLSDRMCEFCREYNVDYFKIDGFAKKPCSARGHNHPVAKGEGLAFYTCFWERWTAAFEKIRAVRPDVCLNITSYVHCSPWFLKWVDYVWMNNASDMGYVGKGDDLSMCLNYRDGRYRNFYEERQLQFPAAHLYNHEPCYAFRNFNTARPWRGKKPVVYTDEQFRDYLKCCFMRGSGLLELYFSPDMMSESKWKIAAEVLSWAEANFDVLSASQFFGGRPEKGEVYGYAAERNGRYAVTVRNSGAKARDYDFDLPAVGRIKGILQPFEIKHFEKL